MEEEDLGTQNENKRRIGDLGSYDNSTEAEELSEQFSLQQRMLL